MLADALNRWIFIRPQSIEMKEKNNKINSIEFTAFIYRRIRTVTFYYYSSPSRRECIAKKENEVLKPIDNDIYHSIQSIQDDRFSLLYSSRVNVVKQNFCVKYLLGNEIERERMRPRQLITGTKRKDVENCVICV